jgi:branched-chain amino acid transport system ATP-binding protein
MLTTENLRVNYGSISALRDVSVRVEAGELVTVIGPNGAGKSSLLNCIAGAVKPSAGSITFDGESITRLRSEQIIRTGLALVPEGRRIFAALTVEDNLMVGATARSDRAAVRREIETWYQRFPALGRLRKGLAGKLSGGEQQQLAISRAMLAKPRLLLLDEPSLGLAPTVVDGVFELLAELPSNGVTVLLVEQNARRALALCNRYYVLRSGAITHEGDRDDLHAAHDLADAYLGPSDREMS